MDLTEIAAQQPPLDPFLIPEVCSAEVRLDDRPRAIRGWAGAPRGPFDVHHAHSGRHGDPPRTRAIRVLTLANTITTSSGYDSDRFVMAQGQGQRFLIEPLWDVESNGIKDFLKASWDCPNFIPPGSRSSRPKK